jgi:hypothetical protein
LSIFAEVKALRRASLRRAHDIAGDPDDAILLAEQVKTASSQFITQHPRNTASVRAMGTMDAMDNLPNWARWIIVFAVWLNPILTYFLAGVVGRFLRRRLRPPPSGLLSSCPPTGSDPKDQPDSGQDRPSILVVIFVL